MFQVGLRRYFLSSSLFLLVSLFGLSLSAAAQQADLVGKIEAVALELYDLAITTPQGTVTHQQVEERLAELRRTLRDRMERSPLMDGAKFARNIEAAHRQMWRKWCETGDGKNASA